MPPMASTRPGSEPLNIQLLVDSIPALIRTARPDGYLDYFNKPWLEYLGITLDEVIGLRWAAFLCPEDLDGFVGELPRGAGERRTRSFREEDHGVSVKLAKG